MGQVITIDEARQGWLLEVASRNYTASTRNYYSLAALMGHEDIHTLKRYLKLVESDARDAHRQYGAVDTFLK